jgi:2-oxoglutarate dehydrogenase E2 component (dihydrolipoamide succinyltransferase)
VKNNLSVEEKNMTVEIKVPVLPESVADATIAAWHKKVGDSVKEGDNLVDLETDKVVLEVPAPADGVLESIKQKEGAVVTANQVLAIIKEGAVAAKASEKTVNQPAVSSEAKQTNDEQSADDLTPAVRRLVAENNIDISKVRGTGKNGRILKQDIEAYLSNGDKAVTTTSAPAAKAMPTGDRVEERVPMSRLRAKIAERLVQVQRDTAMLTTFNEVNMQPVMELRNQYKESFEKRHGVKLGFMSFFTKAVVEALRRFPNVNASIDGSDLIYHAYQDVGIAVSTERGLVVPILRNAELMSFAGIEGKIRELSTKARDGKLTMDEMTGGTFTITNGGVFGSLMSTPIINAPQSAILGMHAIKERPMAVNGEVKILPMMYLALSYDHRIIDGKDSVQFLVTVKELLEDPARLLLEV